MVRFNFRGTGESTGEHQDGVGEIEDVDTAVAHARTLGDRVGIAGWSFGAAMALSWLASTNTADMAYSGVAPPPDRLPDALPVGPKRIILGSREQVVDAARLRSYSEERGIDLVVTPGDHFFHGRGDKIGVLVAQGLETTGAE